MYKRMAASLIPICQTLPGLPRAAQPLWAFRDVRQIPIANIDGFGVHRRQAFLECYVKSLIMILHNVFQCIIFNGMNWTVRFIRYLD